MWRLKSLTFLISFIFLIGSLIDPIFLNEHTHINLTEGMREQLFLTSLLYIGLREKTELNKNGVMITSKILEWFLKIRPK